MADRLHTLTVRVLEREAQLAALAQYAEEARTGQGRLVLVSGEAGVGKSSLLELLRLDLPDATWCWGACDGLFTPRPLAPFLEIADQLGAEESGLSQGWASRDDLFAGLLQLMKDPGELRVFVVEDVHWADEATLDLLRFLGSRLRDSRALLLVSYRDEQLSARDPLRITLGELATQRTTRRVGLPRLSERAVAMLAEGSGLDAADLYRLTGGNPFFLSQVVEHGTTGLPSSARDAVLARVAGLGAQSRAALDVAALLGSRVDPELLVKVAGAPPAVVDELLSSGLLIEDVDQLRFRHEIARLAVEQDIGAHRRTPIHRGILDALLASGCDDDARLAFHAEGCGDAAQVLRCATAAAGRSSALAAHRESIAQYERALRFADAADPSTRAHLHHGFAYQASLVDRWQDCADAAQAALELWREVGDPLREGDTLMVLGRALWRLCQGSESREAVRAALEVLEPLGPSKELAWAHASIAVTWGMESEFGKALEAGHRAQQMAEELDLPDVLSYALNTEAGVVAELGGDWKSCLERALEVALSRGQHEAAGRAYANLHAGLCGELRFAEAEHYFVDGIAHSDEHDMSTYGTCLRGERASTLEKQGHWDEAMALAESLLERVASPVNRLNPLITLGKLRARRGRSGAWELLDEAATAADRLLEPWWIVRARLARAEAHWLSGDVAAAGHEVGLAEARAHECDGWLRGDVTVWRQRITGHGGPAGNAGDVAEPYASELAGDYPGAAARWVDLGCGYEAALSVLHSGDEALLREALARLDALGADPTAAIARQRMRELGVRSIPAGVRSTTRANPAGLTRRESEVLALVCAGLTNGEIAKRLYIAVKTVDHHVSAVLAKLGVASRSGAADEAVRLGLAALAPTVVPAPTAAAATVDAAT